MFPVCILEGRACSSTGEKKTAERGTAAWVASHPFREPELLPGFLVANRNPTARKTVVDSSSGSPIMVVLQGGWGLFSGVSL